MFRIFNLFKFYFLITIFNKLKVQYLLTIKILAEKLNNIFYRRE